MVGGHHKGGAVILHAGESGLGVGSELLGSHYGFGVGGEDSQTGVDVLVGHELEGVGPLFHIGLVVLAEEEALGGIQHELDGDGVGVGVGHHVQGDGGVAAGQLTGLFAQGDTALGVGRRVDYRSRGGGEHADEHDDSQRRGQEFAHTHGITSIST